MKIKMVHDIKSGKPRGYAFIEYEDESSMHGKLTKITIWIFVKHAALSLPPPTHLNSLERDSRTIHSESCYYFFILFPCRQMVSVGFSCVVYY